jgi:hypothetical protein
MANKQKGILAGKKISNNHQTISKESETVILTAKKLEEVTKIVISVIKPVRPGKRSIKRKPINAGFEITVRGSNIIQTLYVYTKEPDKTWSEIESTFKEKYN